MEIGLKELEPFIRDGMHLQSGRPFEKMDGMRSREAVANWLLCAVVDHTGQRELSFTSDPTGGDGVLEDARTGETFLTEHVMVPRHKAGEDADPHALVLDAINEKRAKGGEAYARGKTLVVFLDVASGEWFPNRVAKALPDPLYFDDVWVVGLYGVENDEYVYGVTQLDLSNGNAPAYMVRINPTFTGWGGDGSPITSGASALPTGLYSLALTRPARYRESRADSQFEDEVSARLSGNAWASLSNRPHSGIPDQRQACKVLRSSSEIAPADCRSRPPSSHHHHHHHHHHRRRRRHSRHRE